MLRPTRAALALLLTTLFALPALAQDSARDVVDQTTQAVLAVLKEDGDVEVRRGRIEEIVYVRFDFDTMGKLVLARNWKKFDDGQRTRFIEEFKRHLSRSYGTRIARYEQEEVAVLSEREEKRGDVTVLTEIRGGQFDGAAINYRMRNKDDAGWRVIDVVIEGVSLVSNFRSQFKDIVSKDGPQGLIDQLTAKNDRKNDAKDDEGEATESGTGA